MIKQRFYFSFLFFLAGILLIGAGDPPPRAASSETKSELWSAYLQRTLNGARSHVGIFQLFTPELDSAFISPDGDTAVLWLALRDDHGNLLATEPGLLLAQRLGGKWQVLLPDDPDWNKVFLSLPEEMLPLESRSEFNNVADGISDVKGPLTGYYLPYVAGTSRQLEGSISHFQYIPELGYPSCSQEYCRYAYDIKDAWHFPLVASKDGTVIGSRDSCTDGNPNCTNYIVLRNAAEGTYQIYLHLANGTIPDKLINGTAVKRGQYIGDTDDTGYSTSQHVHFMVTNSIWWGGDGYYWGRSIDIRFTDVFINSGIPRTCYEVTTFPIYDGATDCLGDRSDPRNPANDWFVSGNHGAYPPSGSLTRPAAGTILASGSNSIIDVTANASDDVRVTAVRLVAKLNNQWVEIGPKITSPSQPGLYDWDVNLCEAAPINGSLELALRVWDHEGNVVSVISPRTVEVDNACPPPISQMNPAEGFDSTAVRLSWQAQSQGVDIGSFDLQWRTASGEWSNTNMISVSGSEDSTWFSGEPGENYEFRLRSVDINGQTEPWPENDIAETSQVLPISCIPDPFEIDDGIAQAVILAEDVPAERNLCDRGNVDWFRVTLTEGKNYLLKGNSLAGGAAVTISIFADDGSTLLTTGSAAAIGKDARLLFSPETSGNFYIKVDPFVDNLFGTEAVYHMRFSDVELIFFPLMAR